MPCTGATEYYAAAGITIGGTGAASAAGACVRACVAYRGKRPEWWDDAAVTAWNAPWHGWVAAN